jgi:hypothetical protein
VRRAAALFREQDGVLQAARPIAGEESATSWPPRHPRDHERLLRAEMQKIAEEEESRRPRSSAEAPVEADKERCRRAP